MAEQPIFVEDDYTPQNTDQIKEITPVQGGTLHISMRNPLSLNPIINLDPTVSNVLGLIYQPLFELDNLTPVPVLAQALQISSDYSSAVITLADRNWSDGTPITSQDITFTLNTIRNNNQSPYYNIIRSISNFRVIDSQNVQIYFNAPVGGRVENSLIFPIIPSHFFQGQLTQRNMQALGTGPFTIQSVNLPRQIILVQNQQYYNLPYISAVMVLITQDRQTDFNSLNQNIISTLNSTMQELREFDIAPVNFNITSYSTNKLDFVAFNFDNLALRSTNVRRGIAYSLPNAEIIYTTYLLQAARTSTVIHPSSPIYKNALNYHNSNLESAWNYFTQAGFGEIGGNTMGSVVGGVPIPLRLRILVNNENHERLHLANALRQNLESLGIGIDFITLEFYEYLEELENGRFDLALVGMELGSDLRNLLSTNGSSNIMNFSSQTLDYYLQSIANALTTEQYINAWHDTQTYLNEQLPIIGIAFRNGLVLTNSGVKIPNSPSLSNIYRGIEEWFLY